MFNISRSFVGLEDTKLGYIVVSKDKCDIPSWVKGIKADKEIDMKDLDRPLFKK